MRHCSFACFALCVFAFYGCRITQDMPEKNVLTVSPGVGVSCRFEIGMKKEDVLNSLHGEGVDCGSTIELPSCGCEIHFLPSKNGTLRCNVIKFSRRSETVKRGNDRRLKFSWSKSPSFGWKEIFNQFGVPRRVDPEKFNLLDGSFPFSFVKGGEVRVFYPAEGLCFVGVANGAGADEIQILKKIGQPWEERMEEVDRNARK